MVRKIAFGLLLLLRLATIVIEGAEVGKKRPGPPLIDETTRWSRCAPVNQSIYDFNVLTLDGQTTDLQKYKGHILLVVNVATFCAYTQQYNDFGPLLDENAQMKIVGFPCNQFYLQEPAENHELINGIVHVRPGNNFTIHPNLHLFGKLEVNGEGQHPLYEFLKESCPQTIVQLGHSNELMYNPIRVSDITWNFEKFLLDRQGRPRFRFHPTAWTHGKVLKPFMEQLMSEQ
uniref:Glutathione peroxidase n=1 Tax=Globodera pallida TaxID=36090 RepID=A0A183CF75_GLOPA